MSFYMMDLVRSKVLDLGCVVSNFYETLFELKLTNTRHFETFLMNLRCNRVMFGMILACYKPQAAFRKNDNMFNP